MQCPTRPCPGQFTGRLCPYPCARLVTPSCRYPHPLFGPPFTAPCPVPSPPQQFYPSLPAPPFYALTLLSADRGSFPPAPPATPFLLPPWGAPLSPGASMPFKRLLLALKLYVSHVTLRCTLEAGAQEQQPGCRMGAVLPLNKLRGHGGRRRCFMCTHCTVVALACRHRAVAILTKQTASWQQAALVKHRPAELPVFPSTQHGWPPRQAARPPAQSPCLPPAPL